MKNTKKYAKDLLDFMNAAPTPFQSVDKLSEMLDRAGATRLSEGDSWQIEKDKLYYSTKSGTQLYAFRIGGEPKEVGFRIGAAHHDAPGFRIKTVPSKIDLGYERLCLEGYGGLIIHGWLDRPLALAGRVFYKGENGEAVAKNVNIYKPLLILPSAAIHVVRDVNDNGKFNIQTELLPFFSQNSSGETKFTEFLARETGCKKEDILSFELAPYEYFPGCFVGENEEFISVARLDDASLAYAEIRGLIEGKGGCDIAMVYDHEEIGSNSDRGAKSNVLKMLIDRICESFGYSADDKYRALAKTVVFSADMAHATHPSYTGKAEMNLPVKLNGGPVLKIATRQSYSTSPYGTAFFKLLCEKNKIPYQIFNNRSDAPSGGTIGPIISADLGVVTVDIGNPQLSMHAVRELGGTDDCYHMVKLFSALFKG